MFCTECGAPLAEGHKFCGQCGTPVTTLTTPVASPGSVDFTDVDWREASDIQTVLGHPEVKALVRSAAAQNPNGISGEEFLEKAEPIVTALSGSPLPLKAIVDLAGPLYEKMGIKTGSELKNGYASSFGRTLAALLCALAKQGIVLSRTEKGEDGWLIEAERPIGLLTMAAKLTCIMEQRPEGIMLRTAMVIPGQAFDWGRSKKALDQLHQDILAFRAQQS